MKALLKRIGWALLGIVALAAAIVGVVLVAFVLPDALASSSWPTTQGKITRSRVRNGFDQDDAWPDIGFRYQVDRHIYVSNALSVGYLHDMLASYPFSFVANWTVNRYPVGATVTVYYRPEDPSDGVLEPGLGAAFWSLIWPCIAIPAGLFFSLGFFSAALGHDEPAV